ncbi:MAG TPA: type I-E CRISPR-associated protein Cse2/CasB [Candidatus Binataceae bacterium]|nr:type I-E CRISPR-associated protein Cse2/CasB [Candidatus Binataceae bacterium]
MSHQAPDGPSIAVIIGRIAADLAGSDSGRLAELRRLQPEEPGGSAFWRIVVTQLEPAGYVPGGGEAREDALTRWAVILRALATLEHRAGGTRFGKVLAEAGISELRLNRFLRTSGDALFSHVRTVTHQLATHAQPADLTALALLVLSDGKPNEQAVRQGIANDYYQQVFAAERETV